jgi:hemerythrin-like metal-binding protein
MVHWNSNLSVGIGSIDNQHKKIIELINSFYEGINQNSSKDQLLFLLKGLKEYTQTHFLTEERYMKQYNYPEFEVHKAEHAKFIATINSFEDQYKSGKLFYP